MHVFFFSQVKRLKGQFEQKKQNNGTEDTSSPDGDVLENGADSNIMDIQSKEMPALSIRFRLKVLETFLQLKIFITSLTMIFNRFGS